jgi:hypothetical protein
LIYYTSSPISNGLSVESRAGPLKVDAFDRV